jgi:4-hydroxy-tetrahydrodipicolinate synthase
MPEVGKSRGPAVVTDEINDKVALVSKAFAEAIG